MSDVKIRRTRRSSLFRPLQNTSSPSQCKINKTQYEEDLVQELIEWKTLLKEKENELTKIQNNPIQVDMDVLTKEQTIFCKFVPDFIKFKQDSDDFYRYVEYFLKKHNKFVEKINHFDDILQKKSKSAAEHLNNGVMTDLVTND